MLPIVEVFSKYKAKLGEGPIYDRDNDRLFWVDIEGKKIIIEEGITKNSVEKIVNLPDLVSSLCVINETEVIATIRHGFYILNINTGGLTKLLEIETDLKDNRFNDGKCDPLGRYWAGTMNMKKSGPTGNLYKLESNKISKILGGLTVSNGLGWSPDNDKMYLIDSPVRKVYVFDFNLNRGEIYNKQVLIDFGSEPGNPDGMTVDEEGYLWIAHWGGGKVSRWSPNGKKVFEIKMPVTYVSSVTFGGEDLSTLFITSASKDDEVQSGKLFMVDVKIRGLPSYKFFYNK
ncbi:SMP-30/Gluconolaconase/LRE domain protein [Acidianus hospitalis W1]|uniref:SMP-30/Gluconolaconase/LRE domain protein n=1 Tax=Acidianus hospitalis (strain W1) TaxID=933801 RepID=F4B5C3_ACIHW|nr:SMP-30/gluconolactonase/LRE family protein [Acidianus hospitalis]AEE93217.1 SMP-30/Gluconolaconase/LRE domain protein [Acidianus hospitalis W1]